MDADQALKVFIQFGILNQDQADAAKKILADTTAQTGELTEKTVAHTAKTIEATAESGKENISLREKHEVIRALTTAFPGLAEAAIFALNPMTLAAFAIGGAFEIFKKRVEEATDALSDVEMPDLTSGIDQANSLAEAWNGIADAIDKALAKYNSAESVFGRDTKKTDEEAEIQKKLNLGGQTPGQIDEQAQQQNLAAKYREQANAQIASQTAAQSAAAIKLPDDPKDFEAQQESLKKGAENFRASAKKARENVDFVHQIQVDSESGPLGFAKAVGETAGFVEKFGYGVTGGDVIRDQSRRAISDDQTAARIDKSIAARQKEYERRKKLQEDAEKNAGLAASIGAELPGDRASTAEKSAMDLLEPSKSGQESAAQLRAHIAENNRVMAQLQQAAAEVVRSHTGSNQVLLELIAALHQDDTDLASKINHIQSHVGQ